MGFFSTGKKVAKLMAYSVVGDWSSHKERIDAISKIKKQRKLEKEAIKQDIISNPAKDDADAFLKMCARKGFNELDIEYNLQSYYISLLISLFVLLVMFVVFLGLLFFSQINPIGIACFVLSLIFWSIKTITVWLRFSQLKHRQLFSVKKWLFGQF